MKYEPMDVIGEYTDEYLRSPDSLWGAEAARLLLLLPAEYRQACEIEVSARTGRDGEWAGDLLDIRAQVVGEILSQLGRKVPLPVLAKARWTNMPDGKTTLDGVFRRLYGEKKDHTISAFGSSL